MLRVSARCALLAAAELTSRRGVATAAPGKTKIGFIGTGVMGAAMAGHCLKAGFGLNVYNRSMAKTAGLVKSGATAFTSPRELAAASDVVLSIVGYPADVASVYLDRDGVLAGARAGAIVVDLTTSEPSLAVKIAAAAAERGVTALDAPVSGGDVGAREARLSIMVGGERAAFDAMGPIFRAMGKNIVHMGGPGAGQHTKMANQILIASGMIGVVEGLVYAHRAGLDPTALIAAVSAGAAGSWSLSNYGPRMVAREFAPGFLVEHFIKDMGIALAEAQRMRLALPGLALAAQLYTALAAQGHGKRGTHSLILALESLSSPTPAHGLKPNA